MTHRDGSDQDRWSHFDSFAIVDWSAGNDTGPAPRKDAIWAGLVRDGTEAEPVYLRNRDLARDWIAGLIETEFAAGRRLMIGFDFPFGYPAGFAAKLTGSDDPLAVWAFMARELTDRPEGNTRFDLAGRINAGFPGIGPFWFNGTARDVPDLPRRGRDRTADHGMAERRAAETRAKGAFSCWQMGGAGAVGGQVMTGMAALWRLRERFPGRIAVWPFEPIDAPVVFAEVWPSLIATRVKAEGDAIRDRAQVRLLVRALARQTPGDLAAMLDVEAPEEGWILGLGHEARLVAALAAPRRLKDDCFALPPGVDWVPVDEAVQRLRAAVRPIAAVERVKVMGAAGRIPATPVTARRAHPPRANAAVDGYGFAAAAAGAGPQRLPLVAGRAAAGASFEGHVPHGSALRILTGAPLPDGVDTVVLDEDCAVEPGFVAFQGPVKPGANTRKAGEDVTTGDRVMEAGQRLRPPDLALLAAAGVAKVEVFRPLRVGVLSTGDELAEPGGTDDGTATVDANRPMLLAAIAAWGHGARDLGIAPDDRAEVRAALDDAAAGCDAILTSGGASAGDEDHVSALLRDEGHVAAWRIALKPGRPLMLGAWKGVPVFGLPGNPVAAWICTLIFARPALNVMAGGKWLEQEARIVPAAFSKSKKPGRREYLRARLDDEGKAEVFASEGSGRVSGLSWATGLVELPDAAVEISPGDPVRFLPYSGFGV